MKKTLSIMMVALFVATTTSTNMGCIKKDDDNPVIPSINIPDVSNFSLQGVSAFVKGASTLVSIASTTLADGVYTVYFDLVGANVATNASATMNMSGDAATFSTPVLSNEGNTSIFIKKIVNSSGGEATFSSAVTKTFSDSSGLMTCNISGASAFRATHVNATWLGGSGGMLTVNGVFWDPLTTVRIHWDYYDGTLGTRYFNNKVITSGAWNSVFNGGASYSAPGKSELSANGWITVTAKTATSITGTFSFTCTNHPDSTRVTTGAFNCKLN